MLTVVSLPPGAAALRTANEFSGTRDAILGITSPQSTGLNCFWQRTPTVVRCSPKVNFNVRSRKMSAVWCTCGLLPDIAAVSLRFTWISLPFSRSRMSSLAA